MLKEKWEGKRGMLQGKEVVKEVYEFYMIKKN